MQEVWSNENKQLAASMWRDGKSISDIAKIFDVTRSAMSGLMSRNRDIFPKIGKEQKAGTKWTEEERRKLLFMWNTNLEVKEIAAHFGVSMVKINNYVIRNRTEFPTRNKISIPKPPKEPKPKKHKIVDKILLPDGGTSQKKGDIRSGYVTPELDEYELAQLPGLSLVDNYGCMYPLTDGPENHMFCSADMYKGRYCEHHHNKCCGYQGISIKYRSRYDRNIIRESA